MAAERWLDLLHGNSGLQVHVPVHKAAVGGLCGPSNSRHGCVTSMAFYWLKQVTSPPRFKGREGGPLYLWQVCQGHITEEHGAPWPYLENTICTGVNMNKEEEKQSQWLNQPWSLFNSGLLFSVIIPNPLSQFELLLLLLAEKAF